MREFIEFLPSCYKNILGLTKLKDNEVAVISVLDTLVNAVKSFIQYNPKKKEWIISSKYEEGEVHISGLRQAKGKINASFNSSKEKEEDTSLEYKRFVIDALRFIIVYINKVDNVLIKSCDDLLAYYTSSNGIALEDFCNDMLYMKNIIDTIQQLQVTDKYSYNILSESISAFDVNNEYLNKFLDNYNIYQ